MQAPTSFVPAHLSGVRSLGTTTITQATSGAVAADLLVRGRLGSRAHRLLGLGPVGAARLGQAQPSLAAAFGPDVASWQQLGTPWIAARSLARPRETLASHSTVGWMLANPQGR